MATPPKLPPPKRSPPACAVPSLQSCISEFQERLDTELAAISMFHVEQDFSKAEAKVNRLRGDINPRCNLIRQMTDGYVCKKRLDVASHNYRALMDKYKKVKDELQMLKNSQNNQPDNPDVNEGSQPPSQPDNDREPQPQGDWDEDVLDAGN